MKMGYIRVTTWRKSKTIVIDNMVINKPISSIILRKALVLYAKTRFESAGAERFHYNSAIII